MTLSRLQDRSHLVSGAGSARGFSMIELMITLVVIAVVMVGLAAVLYTASSSKTATSNRLESTQAARVAIDLLARDLRSAGYGADLDWVAAPQPPFAYIDSLQVLMYANLHGDWQGSADTTAYNPAGAPNPFPLVGTSWTPAIKYRTRAEVVRWTLDVNNDGAVDAGDVASAGGVEARRTANPNDYVLARQVYGDSTSTVAGNNGGAVEAIALVKRPSTDGTPPMFTVYFKDEPNPWNWSNGPVPASRLADIERVSIRVVATSPRPDWRRQFAETRLSSEVQSLRNVPQFGANQFAVDGYVFHDFNSDGVKGAGEPGLADALVRLGATSVTTTDANGHYMLREFAGTYTLQHTPPPGYRSLVSPGTVQVTLGPGTSHSFADVPIPGGHTIAWAFEDTDQDGDWDGGEPPLEGVKIQVDPGANWKLTDVAGMVRLFAPVGAYTLTATAPDSAFITSVNPQSGVMANGDSATHRFGASYASTGTIAGKVYRDNDRDGVFDGGEAGIEGVWVGVTPDGNEIMGYAYTDANGNYSITAPANDPPGTQQYFTMAIAPAGYYPTSAGMVGPYLLSGGQAITGHHFGMVAFQVITLNASRVLSLASGDLIEKDWSGGDNQWDSKGHQDADLVLGADAGGTDNISVWFNNYNGAPLFNPNPTYVRTAPHSVLSLALGRLDNGTPLERPDVVTGTQRAATGNFFVWLNQNTSGNLGYLPTAFTPGRNYSTADLGDVTKLVLADIAGGSYPDLIVGTKSPTTGRGTFEVWQNDEGATPTFTRQEIYPTAGSIPGNSLGEVTGMAYADFDLDGDKDLILSTRTGTYSGEVVIMELISRANGNRFRHKNTITFLSSSVSALVASDVNGDGREDLVLGLQNGSGSGSLQYWRNNGSLGFTLASTSITPGIVTSLHAADLGGTALEADGVTRRRDIAMGWREHESSFTGGVRIYFTDGGTVPMSGTDPSGGAVTSMVPALSGTNYNFGVQPSTPSPPYLTDLAAGVKISMTTGALVVFIR